MTAYLIRKNPTDPNRSTPNLFGPQGHNLVPFTRGRPERRVRSPSVIWGHLSFLRGGTKIGTGDRKVERRLRCPSFSAFSSAGLTLTNFMTRFIVLVDASLLPRRWERKGDKLRTRPRLCLGHRNKDYSFYGSVA